MKETVKDPVFGEMTYDFLWEKHETLDLFGKSWEVMLNVNAPRGQSITDAQRDTWQNYLKHRDGIHEAVAEAMKEAINEEIETLVPMWPAAFRIESIDDLASVLTPRFIVITQAAELLFFFDTPWDVDLCDAVKVGTPCVVDSQANLL